MDQLLDLKGLKASETKRMNDFTLVTVPKDRTPPACCARCGANGTARLHGSRRCTYRDTAMYGLPTVIAWDRPRYLCSACGLTSYASSDLFHEDFRVTARLFEWAGERCLLHTFASVAEDIGMDEKSVRRMFDAWAEPKMAKVSNIAPRVLGIDEVHLRKRARGVLIDVEEATLIDLLSTHNRETVAARVARLEGRERVEVVTTDMHAPYHSLSAELLPNAVVVVDKWHVLKYASAGLETVRKAVKASISAKMKTGLRRDRFLLLTRRQRLSPMQELLLATWFEQRPELAAAYWAKEGFYDIYDSADRCEAEATYDAWRAKLPPELEDAFLPLTRAVKNWRKPIFNYFDQRFTNATTEGINGIIKIANRTGRGYSFPVLRQRMLLKHKKRD